MTVRDLHQHCIAAEVIGHRRIILIPRVQLCSPYPAIPFQQCTRPFLIKITFDVNTNQARGHKLTCVEKFKLTTSIYQPTNAHIISYKTLLKHFKTLRYLSILSDHHQGALFFAKVMLQYSQFNWYLQTRCCGSISCCVGMCCGAVARCASYAE